MDDMNTLLICLCMILFGVFFGQFFWISVIFAIALFMIIAFSGKKQEEKKGDSVPMPLVRPIIVKRKYVGPDSIYPEKMEITYNPKDSPNKWDRGKVGAVGNLIGSIGNWLKR